MNNEHIFIQKSVLWDHFFGKNLHLVDSASLCYKSVVMLLVKVLIMSRLKCYQIFFYFILFASEKASKLAIKIKQNSGSTFMGFKLVFVIKKFTCLWVLERNF